MAKGGPIVNQDTEERRDEERNNRGGSSGGIGKGRRESVVARERVRGEGGGGGSSGRRRDRRPKDSTNSALTTPAPDNLPKAFYQAPMILERKPQSQSQSQPQPSTPTQITAIASSSKSEETSPKTRRFPQAPREDTSSTHPIASGSREPEMKPGISRSRQPIEKCFMKLINEKGMFLNENVTKILSDYPGHFIVGVCGPQGAGKSTLISALCQDPSNGFPVQTNEALNLASHETSGVDIHVTPERIILLDTQPIFSLSILERALRNDYISDHILPETWLEMQSLQLVIFLLSVCNVVLTVTESMDFNTWDFLKKAEMLKYRIPEFPSLPSLAPVDGSIEYYPDVVLVCNKTSSADFTAIKYESYSLKYLDGPDNFATLANSLRNQIFEVPKKIGKKGQVSEKEWLRGALKSWEMIRKSDFIVDYCKMSQKLRDM
ncbi:hypothetical protein G9A89_019337 [Geosiphon pyriformis]|nr:hypothetical protein G9A89_019337 [Geosiphon pyriformis]